MPGPISHTDIAVIGAGHAGIALVAKLRRLGFDGTITLIGAETVLPYQRPPLSKKYLLGELGFDRLLLRPRAFYDDHRITLRLGRAVTALNTALRCFMLGDDVVRYDRLVLATGVAARVLPPEIGGGLRGVHHMRNVADIDALAPELRTGRHALIVGGGYIGLEAAAAAAMKGLQVTVVEAGRRILARVAAPETSTYFRDLHGRNGVRLIEDVGIQRLIGDGQVTGAALTDGTMLQADFVIVGIGVVPETSLARAAGLHCDNGVAVDNFGRTSKNGIWAAGDCTSFPYRQRRIRLECVQNAVEQAEAVAADIMQLPQLYDPIPWFWSDQFDVKLQIAGLNDGYDEVVTRVYPDGAMSAWYYREGIFCAVDAMNDPRAFVIGRQLLQQGITPASLSIRNVDINLKYQLG